MTDPKTKQPVENGRRQVWINQVALATALNASYTASKIALSGIVVGFALLLTGIGFAILAIGGALRNPETALTGSAGWRRGAELPVTRSGILRRTEKRAAVGAARFVSGGRDGEAT